MASTVYCLSDAQRQAAAENERQWLQDLDEEEYDALPEEKKHIIQQHRQRLTKDQKRLAKEHGEQRQQEDLKRLKEEELKKNDKKGMKKESQRELSTKKKFLEVKVVCLCFQCQQSFVIIFMNRCTLVHQHLISEQIHYFLITCSQMKN